MFGVVMEISKETIAKKIREIRKERGISQLELANRLGFSQAYIAMIEKGKRDIDTELLNKIANALGVSVAELLSTPEEKKERLDEVEEITDVIIAPVVGEVPAGDLFSGDVEIIDYLPVPRELVRGIPKEAIAWWKVSGNSMYPEIKEGDLVLVASGNFVDIKNGDRVIAIIDNERTLKKFYDKGDYIILQPVNDKDHEPIVIQKDNLKETPIYLYKVLGVFKRY